MDDYTVTTDADGTLRCGKWWAVGGKDPEIGTGGCPSACFVTEREGGVISFNETWCFTPADLRAIAALCEAVLRG